MLCTSVLLVVLVLSVAASPECVPELHAFEKPGYILKPVRPFTDALGLGMVLQEGGEQDLMIIGNLDEPGVQFMFYFSHGFPAPKEYKLITSKDIAYSPPNVAYYERYAIDHWRIFDVGPEVDLSTDVILMWLDADEEPLNDAMFAGLWELIRDGGSLVVCASSLAAPFDPNLIVSMREYMQAGGGLFMHACVTHTSGCVFVRKLIAKGTDSNPTERLIASFAQPRSDIFAKPVHLLAPRAGVAFALSEGQETRSVEYVVRVNEARLPVTTNRLCLSIELDDNVWEQVAWDELSQRCILRGELGTLKPGEHAMSLALHGCENVLDAFHVETIDFAIMPYTPNPGTALSGIDHVFVCHWAPLADRKTMLAKRLEDIGIGASSVTWLTDFDRKTITTETLTKYYFSSRDAWLSRYSWHRPESMWRNLSIGEVCVTACHTQAYELIAANGYQGALVLEDDTVFDEDFATKWNMYMSKLGDAVWDYLFFGLGDQNWQVGDGLFKPKDHPASRTAGSYAISRRAAELLQSSMVPFSTVSDGEMDYQMWLHELKAYWAYPHLAWEGTKKHGATPSIFQSAVTDLRVVTEYLSVVHNAAAGHGVP